MFSLAQCILKDSISVHNPGFYKERFMKFIEANVFKRLPSKPLRRLVQQEPVVKTVVVLLDAWVSPRLTTHTLTTTFAVETKKKSNGKFRSFVHSFLGTPSQSLFALPDCLSIFQPACIVILPLSGSSPVVCFLTCDSVSTRHSPSSRSPLISFWRPRRAYVFD